MTCVAHEPLLGSSAPSVTVPESFIRGQSLRIPLRRTPQGASLQIVQTKRSFLPESFRGGCSIGAGGNNLRSLPHRLGTARSYITDNSNSIELTQVCVV